MSTNWPMPQDFNEAVQNPAASFADPELRDGRPAVGPHGVPLPHSGNYADVYQVRGPDGRDWAVKCFTRPVAGLAARYARVTEALARANLPFGVGFTFLADGVRVRGAWRPVIKMEWVEGKPLNAVVADNTDRPEVLAALARIWVRLSRRLRAAGVVHGDLQHGNVLLVPGSKAGSYAIKLVDYDGMYLPALAGQPSGEAGHPNFQHPARLPTRAYGPDLDRFPLLVVLAALKALEVAGPALWDRYDNGDNLLFTDADFLDPAASPLMRELWRGGHPEVRALVAHLAAACRRPLAETPWVDDIAPAGTVTPADPETERVAAGFFGPSPPDAAPAGLAALTDLRLPDAGLPDLGAPAVEAETEAEAGYEAVPEYEPVDGGYEPVPERDEWSEPPRPKAYPRRPRADAPRPARRRRRKPVAPLVVGAVLLALVGGVVVGAVLLAVKKPAATAQPKAPSPTGPATPETPDPTPGALPVAERPNPFGPIVPPPGPPVVRRPAASGAAAPGLPPAFVVSLHSGKILAVGAEPFAGGKQVLTADKAPNNQQQLWRIIPAGGEWVYLEHAPTGTVMTVGRNGTADGAEVVAAAREEPASEFQQWKTVPVLGRPGAVKVVSRGSGRVIGVDAGLRTSGARILIWTDLDVANQTFGLSYPGAETPTTPAATKSPWELFDLSQAVVVDEVIRIKRHTRVSTRVPVAGPFQVAVVARTEEKQIRLGGPGGSEVVFNVDRDPRVLHATRGSASDRRSTQAVMTPLVPGKWYALGWRLTAERLTVWVDDKIVLDEAGANDLSHAQHVLVEASSSTVEVRSINLTLLN